jgi:molecular chaperone GrpE
MKDEIKKEPEVDTDRGDDYMEDVVFEDNTEVTGGDHQKKIAQVKVKLKEVEEKAASYLDNWQRDKAEFLNVRRRDQESQTEFLKFANEKLILEIIPVLDSFDSALTHATDNPEMQKGIEQIKNQLIGVLEKSGVKKFSPLGEVFDPARSMAIATVPGEDGKVMEVIQAGYELNGKVIRPAMVKVAE